MSTHTIAVLVGSLRRESFNRRLAAGLRALAPKDFSFEDVRIDDLPLYNQDDDDSPAPPVKRLRDQVRAAGGLLFVTPEYNRSIPGVLKNAIDHGSRPYGQSVWAGKPAGILGVSVGQIGTAIAQGHLRTVLAYLDAPALGQPECYLQVRDGMFEGDGIGPASREFLQAWMDSYVRWVKEHAG